MPDKYLLLLCFILLSLIITACRIFPKNEVRIDLRNTNTKISLKFGDIFQSEGNIAIGVNEYFDSEINDEQLVSPKSLHGLFIQTILGGRNQLFDQAVVETLKDKKYTTNNRTKGKSKKYDIGTTAHLSFNNKKYLLFAIAKTNEKFEAHTTPSLIFEALEGLFECARTECNGYDLNIPLIGTGLSRAGIPPKRILDMIMIAILQATKTDEITKNINIIIHNNFFEKIDLNEIKKQWQ
jgi:hypothetical protein